jgi:hypothetical protein
MMTLMRFLAYFGRVVLPPEEREKTQISFTVNDKPMKIQSIGFDSGVNTWIVRLKG